jgi:hypothetical protein
MSWNLIIRTVSAVVIVGLVALATRYLDAPIPRPGMPSDEILRKEFTAIPIPREHKPIDALSVVNRRDMIVVGRNYESASPPGDVVKYYLNKLPALGWKVHSTRAVPVTEPQIILCKFPMALAVDFIAQQDNSSHYYLGITWMYPPESNHDCGGQH